MAEGKKKEGEKRKRCPAGSRWDANKEKCVKRRVPKEEKEEQETEDED